MFKENSRSSASRSSLELPTLLEL